jgi:hypothetical protein
LAAGRELKAERERSEQRDTYGDSDNNAENR